MPYQVVAGRTVGVRVFTLVCALVALLAASAAAAVAAPAPQRIRPDTSFGPAHNGITTTDVGGRAFAEAVAVQSDGKTVVGGWGGSLFKVARYLPNGDLDPSFGAPTASGTAHTGIASIAFPGADQAQLNALRIQSDGRIVVAGWVHPVGTANHAVALARLAADGSLDQSFGVGGRVQTLGADTLRLEANALALQADGKIVVAGDRLCTDVTGCQAMALVRYSADGTLDAGFGQDGIAVSLGPGSFANALGVQRDGKLVIAGTNSNRSFVTARFTPAGQPDAGFGSGGSVVTSFGSLTNAGATALVIRPDGKLLVAGWEEFGPGQSLRQGMLVQLTTDGTPDAGFGTAGATDVVLGVSRASREVALVRNPDGSLVLGSGSQDDSQALTALGAKFSIAVVDATGHQLPPFYVTGFNGGGDGRALALTRDGKVVQAGLAARGQFGVARYLQPLRPCVPFDPRCRVPAG